MKKSIIIFFIVFAASLLSQNQGSKIKKLAEAHFQKALEWYYHKNHYTKSWKELQKALRLAKDPRYLAQKGRMMLSGKGTQKDETGYDLLYQQIEAFKKNKDGFSLYFLGFLYSEGIGLEYNTAKGIEVYEKAIKANNSFAIRNLGYLYYDGEDVDHDEEKSFHLFQKAAKLGHSTSMYYLALFYENDEVVPKDSEKAMYWSLKSAQNGNIDAIHDVTKKLQKDGRLDFFSHC